MTTQQVLDERYGRRTSHGRRRLLWTIVGVVAVASVGVLAWLTLMNPANLVHAEGTGFELTDERTVQVSFQLTAPPGSGAVCALEALDEDFGIVGWRVVEYAPSESRTRAITETIPTVAAATTGLVNSCWLP